MIIDNKIMNTIIKLKNECSICYNDKIIIPCGSFNNCNASVCNDCYYRCSSKLYFMSFECIYCKSYNFKKGLIDELNEVFGEYSEYQTNKYIIWLQLWKNNKDLLDDCINDDIIMPCIPCD